MSARILLSPLLGAEITRMRQQARFLTRVPGIKTRASRLQSQHFTYWAISSTLSRALSVIHRLVVEPGDSWFSRSVFSDSPCVKFGIFNISLNKALEFYIHAGEMA